MGCGTFILACAAINKVAMLTATNAAEPVKTGVDASSGETTLLSRRDGKN
jgi:hypothetical protein